MDATAWAWPSLAPYFIWVTADYHWEKRCAGTRGPEFRRINT